MEYPSAINIIIHLNKVIVFVFVSDIYLFLKHNGDMQSIQGPFTNVIEEKIFRK